MVSAFTPVLLWLLSLVVDSHTGFWLHRADLSVEGLAHAGARGAEVSAAVRDAADFLGNRTNELQTLDAQAAELHAEMCLLRSRIQRGLGGGQDVDRVAAIRQQLQNVKSARGVLLDQIFTAAAARLADQTGEQLERFALNRAKGAGIPMRFRAVERSQAEWVQLRRALHAVRIGAELDCQVDSRWTELATRTEAEAAVVQARVNRELRYAEVLSAWNAAHSD